MFLKEYILICKGNKGKKEYNYFLFFRAILCNKLPQHLPLEIFLKMKNIPEYHNIQ